MEMSYTLLEMIQVVCLSVYENTFTVQQ